MTNYYLPESIIKNTLERGTQLRNLLITPSPEKYETGQIWSTYQFLELDNQEFYADEPKLVVIIDVQQEDTTLITAAPLSTETHFASEYDLIIAKRNSPLGFSFMIEVWNQTPVYEKHLKNFFGNLSDVEVNVLTQIHSLQLFNDPVPESLSRWVGLKLYGEEDPRFVYQEQEMIAISYLTEAATFRVSLSLSGADETEFSEAVSKFVCRIKPIFDSLSNYKPLINRKLAFAATEYENKTFILASPDKGKKFIFELVEGLPPTKDLFLIVHFVKKDFENKKCVTKFLSEELEFEFPSFTLKEGVEVKANVGSDYNILDFTEAEIKVG